MIRYLLLLIVFVPVLCATAAELPKDISTEDREDWVKKWQDGYTKKRDEFRDQIAEAKTLIKFAGTAAKGKKQLAKAEADLAALEKNPLNYEGHPWKSAGLKVPMAGDVVFLQATAGQFAVTEQRKEGVVVESVVQSGGKTVISHYLVASPITVPKAVGKKEPLVQLPGLWYVAGTVEIGDKSVPVLYKFEIKKDDFPPEKK